MEKYENSEYEMLKRSLENNNIQTSSIESKTKTKTKTVSIDENNNLKGIASLVLGLITLILHHLWFVAIITGIIGLVLGVKTNIKGNRNKKGKAGMILSIVGLSIMVAIYGFLTVLAIVAYL